jgi:HD-GYP domain-containing protein (c-di-GMP phosphodiesterase class II)
MLSPRCYREPCSCIEVIAELHRGRGEQFDPRVAELASTWLAANS